MSQTSSARVLSRWSRVCTAAGREARRRAVCDSIGAGTTYTFIKETDYNKLQGIKLLR